MDGCSWCTTGSSEVEAACSASLWQSQSLCYKGGLTICSSKRWPLCRTQGVMITYVRIRIIILWDSVLRNDTAFEICKVPRENISMGNNSLCTHLWPPGFFALLDRCNLALPFFTQAVVSVSNGSGWCQKGKVDGSLLRKIWTPALILFYKLSPTKIS